MSDYAPNYTNRYRLSYSSQGQVHKMAFRYGGITPTPPGPAVATSVLAFLNALTAQRHADWSILGADAQQAAASFFAPAPTPGDPDTGTGLAVAGAKPAYISFQGLSVLGNRASIVIFGVDIDPIQDAPTTQSDYRVTATEAPWVANAVTALQAAPFCAIDGASITWYLYANVGLNAYYQRKARAG